MNDPISAEEYFRGTLKVIAHWSEVDLSAEWETGLRGVIRSITDAAREVLSAHPTSQHSSSPGAAFAEPTTVAANAYDGSDARPNSGLDSRDRGHNEALIRQLREMATEFAIDNKTDCKQHICWIAADRLASLNSLHTTEVMHVARAIAENGVGRPWDDLPANSAFELCQNDLLAYAEAAVNAMSTPVARMGFIER